jgi:hypothetical protein
VLARPSVAVKIGNDEKVRPQAGLDRADVVYEELTEGGITRFLALFHSQLPPRVGPTRSVRAVDPALAAPQGGVFAYSGGVPTNVDAIEGAPVTAVDETAAGDAMQRDDSIERPHNLFTIPEAMLELAGDHDDPPPPLFEYGKALASAGAEPCPNVTIAFGSDDFTSIYMGQNGKGWARSTPNGPFPADNGGQITTTNVVVLRVADQSAGATVGSGEALVFRNDTMATGTWNRDDENDAWNLRDAEGKPLKLARGKTWVHLAVPDTVVTTCSAG